MSTVALTAYPAPIAFVQPAGVPMTLPVHADQIPPVFTPAPRYRLPTKPANRLAWPALTANEPCTRCRASTLMRRNYHYRGTLVSICIVCGWDSGRRAGEGLPDTCMVTATPFHPPCDQLRPCGKHS